MATAQENIDTIILNAITTANEHTDEAKSAAEDLLSVNAGFYLTPPTNLTGFEVTAVEPDIPTVADSTLTYDAQLEKLIVLLSGQLANFFTTYYPLSNDAFDEATAWLINTITNGGTGINQAVWDQVWQRARENTIADGRRVHAQIVTGFSAKGIMLPAGAMVKKISESLFDQTGKTGALATANAMKQVEIEVETIKFAIGEAMKSRQMAMQAAADYIRSIASAPDAAARFAGLNTDNQARMMSSAADFYRARMGRDELVLKSKLAELGTGFDIYSARQTNGIESDKVKAQALTSAADVFARTASAALSSLNSIVSSATNAFA
jgi:hypothetical protein